MKRLQIRENEPPLRYFLEPRRGKVGKLTDKIRSVTNSILSFVKEYYDNSKNNTSKYAGSGNLWEANLQTIQKDNQANNLFNKTLENAAKTRASKFIRFQDISSQQENQLQENQIITNKVQECYPQLAENESRLDQKDEEKQVQQIDQGYIIHQGLYNIQQNAQIDQDQSEQQLHQLTESIELQGIKRNRELPHNNSNDKKSPQQYQVCLASSDDAEVLSQIQLPRKRVKLMYERQLGYINQLNQNKWKVYKETQHNIQKNTKRKSPIGSSNKVDTIQKSQQIPNQPIINLVQKLQTIDKRRNSMNRNINKSQYFTPIQNVIRPKKFNLNQQKIIQILRHPTLKPSKMLQIPILKNTDEKIQNKQTPLISNNQNGTNFFTPSFNIPTLIPKTNIVQQQKAQIKQAEINKGFSFNLYSNEIALKKIPQYKQQKQKKSQQMLQNNTPISKQDVNIIKQTENKQIIVNQKKQEIKQNKETKKDNVQIQNKAQTVENKPEVKTLKQNPFIQKSSNNIRQLLPQLLAKPLFGKTDAGPSIFDNLFQKKQSKNQFSTPTKNIYQKYPDIKPNPIINVSAPIPESQEDESSMFDQSSFSTSKRQDPSPMKANLSLFPGPGTSNNGSFFGSNNTFLSQKEGGFEKSQNLFFSNMPNVDASKSVQMFGRLSNDSNQDSLFVSPLGDQNKKISTNKNKKKTKQQRAYG